MQVVEQLFLTANKENDTEDNLHSSESFRIIESIVQQLF